LSKEGYGRAFEAAVGACLINNEFEVSYWRDGSAEVDFVVAFEGKLLAVEVKSGRARSSKGMSEFQKRHPKAIEIYITPENVQNFFKEPRMFFGRLT